MTSERQSTEPNVNEPQLPKTAPADNPSHKEPAVSLEAVENSPPDMRVGYTRTEMIHSGPIPPASEMKGYHEIDPEFPRRIFAMAEYEQKKRIECQEKIISNEAAIIKRAQIATACMTLALLATAAWIAYLGQSAGAAVAAAAGILLPIFNRLMSYLEGRKSNDTNSENE